jgi:restriction system protein
MHAFLDHGNITAPPIVDEFNFLARGLRAGDEDAFSGPWPSDRAAWRRRHQKYRSHQRKAGQAQQVLAKLATFKGNGDAARILGYLRKIDPYVFEELVLLMLEQQGIVVIRNESYSGDGGLDGAFVHQGCRYLLQAKRYKGAVSAAHVKDFAALITQHQAQGGVFIHTGKTPKDVYRALGAASKITLVSGQKLVDLIQGEPLTLWSAHNP